MLAPKLRFKEFEDNWKELKLKDVSDRVTRKNINNETTLPLTISSLDGLVDQRIYFNKSIASKDMSSYYLLIKGEFAYNKSYSAGFNYGSIKRLDNYDKGALSTLYICFKLKKIINSDFIYKYFDSLKWNREVYKVCTEGARNHGLLNISPEDFFDIKLKLPDIREQEKIALFLNLLDKKIELQQRKIEVLKMYKKGLSDNIYASLKEKTIELNNYAIVQGGFAFKSELFQKKGKPIIRISNIYNNLVNLNDLVYYNSNLAIDKKFYVNNSDLLIAMSGATTGKYGIYHNTYTAYLNQRVGKIICKRDTILYYPYLYFLFGLTAYEKQLQSRLVAGAQPNISPTDIETMRFKFPNINNQKKIADIIINITKKYLLKIEN